MAKITPEIESALKSKLDSVTSKPNGVPGLVYVAVNKDGDTVFEHASGKRGLDSKEPMTTDTVFWIASCTKMITSIAAMQLVEQGKLALDDVALVERLAPELRDVKVLQEDASGNLTLVEKERGITLRMLLSHTAGFGYDFLNTKLRKWSEPVGVSALSARKGDILLQPLVNQPGSRWEYGVNLDWAGELVMRASGLKLNDYMQKHIFEPLGVKNISMFPTGDMKRRLAWVHSRASDGTLSTREEGHVYQAPLRINTPEEYESTYHSGGAGCFAVPREYCKIIAVLLNNGRCPKSGAQILKPESVEELVKNQIPEFPDFGRQGILSSKSWISKTSYDIYPQPNKPQGWGFAGFHHIHGTPTGRAPGTVFWSGVANLFWFADRERGLGGLIASQIVPFADLAVVTAAAEIEAGLYAALGSKGPESASVL
ncbi:beta-lactamase family protein [Paecilomyces variotii No. 5]|uniref:Beta-lactamase family protein n=1 Tax=Byssochlamys spectabilis (strain No. 5 / NBRC 109023) TaxID=1356009 RepID=V5FTN5_BYSSN|nr:beta-lactamase family protein [Paecilomyces variotii No. 5]